MKRQDRLELSDNLTSPQIQVEIRHSRVVSLDLWHLKMDKGNEAYYQNNPVTALRYFKQAVEIADSLLFLSIQQGSDPTAALKATVQSLRNLTELYLRYELIEEAISLREDLFYRLVDRLNWKDVPLNYATSYVMALENELDDLLTLYYALNTDQEIISAALLTIQNIKDLLSADR